MAYSEYQKAMAVDLIERNGGVLDKLCLDSIRVALNAPGLTDRTIRYWLDPDSKKITTEKSKTLPGEISVTQRVEQIMVDKVRKSLDDKFEDVAHLMVDHASKTGVINKMSGQAAVLAAATAVDKMRLLRGLPTGIIQILPEIVSEMQIRGIDVTEVFQKLLAKVKASQHV